MFLIGPESTVNVSIYFYQFESYYSPPLDWLVSVSVSVCFRVDVLCPDVQMGLYMVHSSRITARVAFCAFPVMIGMRGNTC